MGSLGFDGSNRGSAGVRGSQRVRVFVVENRQHIVYRGVDGHIDDLANSLGQ